MQCVPISVLGRDYSELEHASSTPDANCGKGARRSDRNEFTQNCLGRKRRIRLPGKTDLAVCVLLARRESRSRLERPRRLGGRANRTCSARDVVAWSNFYISIWRDGKSPANYGPRARRVMNTVVGWATAKSAAASCGADHDRLPACTVEPRR
jgi:hypothetical protein